MNLHPILLGKNNPNSATNRIHAHKDKNNDYASSSHRLTDYRVYVDSGAHTLYNFHVRDNQDYNSLMQQGKDPFAFYDSKEFNSYLEDYIEFLHINKEHLEFYVTLDVIKNPKRTWEVTKYMESCGLNPLPVYHYGEDISWFKKMLDEYDYIGIGGLGQEVSKTLFFPFADKLFKLMCDSKGKPRVKTHGFAITAIDVLMNYPWFTTDSSTWTTLSRSGNIYIPRMTGKSYNYMTTPFTVAFTEGRRKSTQHYVNQTPSVQKYVRDYIDFLGLSMEKISTLFHFRDVANIRFYLEIEKRLKLFYGEKFEYEEGGNILFAGTPSGSSSNISKFARLLDDLQTDRLGWLSSVYYPLVLNNAIEMKRTLSKGKSIMQNKMHKPGKIQLNKSEAPKKVESLLPKIIKMKVQVTYEYEYTINAAPYKNKNPDQILEKESKMIKKEFSKIGHKPKLFNVEVTQ